MLKYLNWALPPLKTKDQRNPPLMANVISAARRTDRQCSVLSLNSPSCHQTPQHCSGWCKFGTGPVRFRDKSWTYRRCQETTPIFILGRECDFNTENAVIYALSLVPSVLKLWWKLAQVFATSVVRATCRLSAKPSLRRISEVVATWKAIDSITQLLSLTIPCGSLSAYDVCMYEYV
jgi:hypothetical protein